LQWMRFTSKQQNKKLRPASFVAASGRRCGDGI